MNVYPSNPNMGYYGYQGNPMAYYNKPAAKFTQPLSDQQINQLKQHEDELSVKIDQEDIWRAQCTHKHNGEFTLQQFINTDDQGNQETEFVCSICGARFKIFEGDVDKTIKDFKDIIQTVKAFYLDAPNEFTAAYFQFLPLVDKLKPLWDRAVRNFYSYNVNLNNGYPIGSTYIGNNFNVLDNLMGQPYYAGMTPYQQMAAGPINQPMMQPAMAPQGYPMNQPMMMQGYPMAQPAMAAPTMNPFVQQAPAPGMMPQPQLATQPQPAVQPADNGEVVQKKSFSV